ncbi:MAG: cytidylate kinase [Candidatus Solincola sediminis]|nr:MAG: cytidylate kinase [Candidatus Solincola sediminis]
MKNNRYAGVIIAIDGPAGAGKSTVAQKLASQLGLNYMDTGALYRAVTLLALRNHVELEDEKQLARLARDMKLTVDHRDGKRPPDRVFIDGEDITKAIRSNEVSEKVSRVSSHRAVRSQLVKKQCAMAEGGGIVVEGRDIGTVVFPQADLKFYVTASANERAKRRYEEMKKEGHGVSLQSIEREIIRRDHQDSTRATNPLKQASDAVLIDTTGKSIAEVLGILANIVREHTGRAGNDIEA